MPINRKSCSHNQSDQRSLSVWSSVKFDPLAVASLETDGALEMASEVQDRAKQMCFIAQYRRPT